MSTRFSGALHQRLPILAFTALDLALLVAIAFALARMTWLLVPPTDDAALPEPPGPAPATAGATRSAQANVDAVTAAHLFGRDAPMTVDAASPAVVSPEVLTLRGVLLSDIPDATRALIASEGGPEAAYAPGATLPGGARLLEVRPDEVVIWRDARTQTLSLSPPAGDGRDARLQQVDHRADAGMARRLGDLQRQLQRDPSATVGLLRFEPIHRRGRLVGFRVNPGRSAGLLDSLGLRPGDVVSAVNGIPLESIPNGFEALEQLTSAHEVRLDVARGDERLVYAYRVQRPVP